MKLVVSVVIDNYFVVCATLHDVQDKKKIVSQSNAITGTVVLRYCTHLSYEKYVIWYDSTNNRPDFCPEFLPLIHAADILGLMKINGYVNEFSVEYICGSIFLSRASVV